MPPTELQSLLEAAVDAILVIDHRGLVSTFNPSAERIFGYPAAEVLGKNVSLLMPEPYRSAHDGYLARYTQTGVPHIMGVGREVEARRKDGSIFAASLAVGRIEGSAPPKYVGFVRDITAQREALATIRRERDRSNGYLELFPHVLMTLDQQQAIVSVNEHACALLDSTEHDLTGKPFLDVAVSVDDVERVTMAFASPGRSGSGHHRIDFTCRTPGPLSRTLSWRCVQVEDGLLCAGEDVTDALRRESEAAESQSRLTNVARFATMGELATGIAHELNQPLAAITNYARAAQRFLSRPQPDIEETKVALDEIASEALRAGGIIHRLRRIIDGQRGERQPTDVNELIEDLQQLTGAEARAHSARVEYTLSRPLPRIVIDPAELQHALLNLARNALEAVSQSAPADREIRIATRRDDSGDVEILVSDNGPGVDEAMLARMFEAFSTSKPGGTGLGLAISRSLVKSNGGQLDYSRAEPRGAVFRIRFPVMEEPVS